MGKFYQSSSYQFHPDSPEHERMETFWDERLVEQFLSLNNPRPTIIELENVSGSRQDSVCSKFMIELENVSRSKRSYFPNFKLTVRGGYRGMRRHWGYIENPDKPGWSKWDPTAYAELLISEAQSRKELMRTAIKQRGIEPIDSSPNHIPWHNPDDIRLGKGILKLGRLLEEGETITRRKICARLVKELSSKVDKSEIERLCPAEWKPKPKQPAPIVAPAPVPTTPQTQ